MGLQLHQTAGLPRGIGLFPQLVDGPVDLADPLVPVHHLHLHHHPRPRAVEQVAAPGVAHDGGVICDAEIVGDQVVVLDRPAGEPDLFGKDPFHVLVFCKAINLSLVKIHGIIVFQKHHQFLLRENMAFHIVAAHGSHHGLRLAHEHILILVEKHQIVKGHIHLLPLIEEPDLLHAVVDDAHPGSQLLLVEQAVDISLFQFLYLPLLCLQVGIIDHRPVDLYQSGGLRA